MVIERLKVVIFRRLGSPNLFHHESIVATLAAHGSAAHQFAAARLGAARSPSSLRLALSASSPGARRSVLPAAHQFSVPECQSSASSKQAGPGSRASESARGRVQERFAPALACRGCLASAARIHGAALSSDPRLCHPSGIDILPGAISLEFGLLKLNHSCL